MRPWTSSEIAYLEDHAHEGVSSVAKALNRTEQAVNAQAKRYGISLHKRWFCPNCNQETYRPLSSKTGWCANCTRMKRLNNTEQERNN